MRNCVLTGTEAYWNKIARSGVKLLNDIQGNKTITLGALISNIQKSCASIMIKIDKLTCNFTKSEPKLVIHENISYKLNNP